jgi:hypothetical protein
LSPWLVAVLSWRTASIVWGLLIGVPSQAKDLQNSVARSSRGVTIAAFLMIAKEWLEKLAAAPAGANFRRNEDGGMKMAE